MLINCIHRTGQILFSLSLALSLSFLSVQLFAWKLAIIRVWRFILKMSLISFTVYFYVLSWAEQNRAEQSIASYLVVSWPSFSLVQTQKLCTVAAFRSFVHFTCIFPWKAEEDDTFGMYVCICVCQLTMQSYFLNAKHKVDMRVSYHNHYVYLLMYLATGIINKIMIILQMV